MKTTNSLFYEALQEIESKICNSSFPLISEQIASSLFYFMYYLHTDNNEYHHRAMILLNNLISETVNNEASNNSQFFSGTAGIGWLLIFLSEEGLIEVDIDDFFSDSFDNYLYQEQLSMLYQQNYSFAEGAMGPAFYFIRRYSTTKNAEIKNRFKNYIVEEIFFIENYKNSDFAGISKDSLTAIINFLIRVSLLNEFSPIVDPLLKYAANKFYILLEASNVLSLEELTCLINLSNHKGDNHRLKMIVSKLLRNDCFNLERSNSNQTIYIGYLYYELSSSLKDERFRYLGDSWLMKALEVYGSDKSLNNKPDLRNGNILLGLCIMSLFGNLTSSWLQYSLIDSGLKKLNYND